MAEPVKPGWYPRPDMQDTLGFWDGEKWTEHTAPRTQAPVASEVMASKGRTPGIVVAAFVFSLPGFVYGFPPFVGLVLGIIGRGRAKAAGRGVGMATAAIVISTVWLLAGTSLIAANVINGSNANRSSVYSGVETVSDVCREFGILMNIPGSQITTEELGVRMWALVDATDNKPALADIHQRLLGWVQVSPYGANNPFDGDALIQATKDFVFACS